MMFEEVKSYVDNYILHSASFETATEKVQRKAANNAEAVLYSMYSRFKPDHNPLPIEAIAHQAVFMLSKDDSALRADNGVSSVGFNGVAISFASTQRMIAPDVIRILGRRVGSYSVNVDDTNRGVYDD